MPNKKITQIGTDETLCPVCGEHHFEGVGFDEICPVCDWEDDGYQRRYPDEDGCANLISLNEARRRWKKYRNINKE